MLLLYYLFCRKKSHTRTIRRQDACVQNNRLLYVHLDDLELLQTAEQKRNRENKRMCRIGRVCVRSLIELGVADPFTESF